MQKLLTKKRPSLSSPSRERRLRQAGLRILKLPVKAKARRAARKPDDISYCYSFEATGKCVQPLGECKFPHLTRAEVTSLTEKKCACAIEVCAPAIELCEIPRRQSQMHRLACAPVAEDVPEINLPVEVISTAAASLGVSPRDAAPQHDFGPISRSDYLDHLSGGSPFSIEFLVFLQERYQDEEDNPSNRRQKEAKASSL